MMALMGTPLGSSQSGSMVGHCEAGAVKRRVGMGSLGSGLSGDFGRPAIALPIEALGGGLVGHAFPPDAAFGRERHVGEDGVAGQRGHGVGIGLVAGAGSDAEESGLGIDGAELAVRVGMNPGDVVADGPHLPALEAFGRNHHGEVGLAAGGRKCGGDIGLFAFRALHADDEHVLGHPAFVAGDVGGDAQGKALLAQQGVAAVAGAIGPDLARLREMDDVFRLVAGPGDVASGPGASGAPTECMQGTTRLTSLSISRRPARRCAP